MQKWPESSMTVACNSDCECDSEYVECINNYNYINIIMSLYVY